MMAVAILWPIPPTNSAKPFTNLLAPPSMSKNSLENLWVTPAAKNCPLSFAVKDAPSKRVKKSAMIRKLILLLTFLKR